MEMETDLKKTFADLEYVSTTADIWTAQNKSFLGITVHWIDPASLQRQKAAIACRRFRGRHTYDTIAAEIEQIHSSFALCGKITAMRRRTGQKRSERRERPKMRARETECDREREGESDSERERPKMRARETEINL